MNIVNTRILYHWLLWLSAACIAVLGFLLVQSYTRTAQLKDELLAANTRSAVYQSQTPQEIERKALRLVEKREKWYGREVIYLSYDKRHWIYRKKYVWTVGITKKDDPKGQTCILSWVELKLDDSGKLISYVTSSKR